MNHGSASFLCLGHPFPTDGVVFGSIAAHYQNTVTVLEVDPVIGHRAASERLCQSRNSCAVSNTCLVLYVRQSQTAEKCLVDPALLVVHGGRADGGQRFRAVDDLAFCVFLGEGFVTDFLYALGDFRDGPVPALFFPLVAAGGAVLNLGDACGVFSQLVDGRAFGAESALIDGMIRVAFDVDGAVCFLDRKSVV